MPKRIETGGATVTFTFDGRPVTAIAGDSVAEALAAGGVTRLRDSVVSGAPRGIHCMMGACFDCLVEIDGIPNRQACMTPAAEGMTVRAQQGAVSMSEGGRA